MELKTELNTRQRANYFVSASWFPNDSGRLCLQGQRLLSLVVSYCSAQHKKKNQTQLISVLLVVLLVFLLLWLLRLLFSLMLVLRLVLLLLVLLVRLLLWWL
jgi:hypothetical protein